MDQTETEFMKLAPGVGVIPEKFRNRGYNKLDWGAGEGGIRMPGSSPKEAGDDRVNAFLAGVAAGADPAQLAGNLLGDSKPTSARKRAAKELI